MNGEWTETTRSGPHPLSHRYPGPALLETHPTTRPRITEKGGPQLRTPRNHSLRGSLCTLGTVTSTRSWTSGSWDDPSPHTVNDPVTRDDPGDTGGSVGSSYYVTPCLSGQNPHPGTPRPRPPEYQSGGDQDPIVKGLPGPYGTLFSEGSTESSPMFHGI